MLSSPRVDKQSFFSAFVADLQPRHIITALVLLALASALSRFLNAAFTRAAERHKSRGTYLPETATQMAVTRRLSNVAVWLTAAAMGLSQFPQLRVLSTGLLASAGLSGLVVGFAARGTLGNAIAGLTISFSQPVRIGDDIELRGERGVVEDIHLIFTVVKLSDGRRLVIPNDTLANEVIKNATMGGVTRVARCDVLVPPGGPVELVREAMLLVARGYEALDRTATPEVLFVRIDERGTLIRLVAPCSDVKAAEKLVQKVLARASDVVFRRSLA